jgi:hypothetical protein
VQQAFKSWKFTRLFRRVGIEPRKMPSQRHILVMITDVTLSCPRDVQGQFAWCQRPKVSGIEVARDIRSKEVIPIPAYFAFRGRSGAAFALGNASCIDR